MRRLRSWLWDAHLPDLKPLYEQPIFLLWPYRPSLDGAPWPYNPALDKIPWHRFRHVRDDFRLGPLCVVCGRQWDWGKAPRYRCRFMGIAMEAEVCSHCYPRLVRIELPASPPQEHLVRPVVLGVYR